MAVEKVTHSVSMVLTVVEGLDNEGNQIRRNRTYSRIKPQANVDDIYEVGIALGDLMSAMVEEVEQREYSTLYNIE